MKTYKAEIGLLTAAAIWGLGFVFTKICMEADITPMQSMFARSFIGSILISFFALRSVKKSSTSGINKLSDILGKKLFLAGALLGVVLFISFAFQTYGIKYTTASKNAFLTSTYVVFVPFIGYWLFKSKLKAFSILGAIMALIGAAILSLQLDFTVNIGDILTIFSAVGFAFQIVLTAEFSKRHSALLLTTIQLHVMSLISFLTMLAIGETNFHTNMLGIIALIYLAVFSTTIAFFMQTHFQKFISETTAGIILSMEAVFGAIAAIIFLSDPISVRMVVGSVVILAAIMVSEINKFSHKPM